MEVVLIVLSYVFLLKSFSYYGENGIWIDVSVKSDDR